MNVPQSLLTALAQTYLTQSIQFAVSIYVARTLTPDEIGIFAVAFVIIILLNGVRDFGTGDYLVQVKEISNQHISSVYTVTFGMGCLVATLVYIASRLAGAYYDNEGVQDVLQLLSFNFIVMPLATVQMALLRRKLEFKTLATVNTVSSVVSAIVTIYLTQCGFSYISMAWGVLASGITNVVLVMIFLGKDYRISFGIANVRNVLEFGALHTGGTMLYDISRTVPDLIIGRVIGLGAVAYYSRAVGLLDLFNRAFMQSVHVIALPHLASKNRSSENLSTIYSNIMVVISGLAWPFYVYIGIVSEQLIYLLFGSQWRNASLLVPYLVIGEIFMAPHILLGAVLIAKGLVSHDAWRQLFIAIFQIIGVAIAVDYGLLYVAIAYSIIALFASILSFYLTFSILELSYASMLSRLIPSVVVAISVGLPLFFFENILSYLNFGQYLQFFILTIMAIVFWLFAVFVTGHGALIAMRDFFSGFYSK